MTWLFIEKFPANLESKNQNTPRTREFSNLRKYKRNIQKSIVFLNISNEYMDTEVKTTIEFIIDAPEEEFKNIILIIKV